MKRYSNFIILLLTFLLISCEHTKSIVTGVDEREANIILVFLESRGIHAYKEQMATGVAVGGETQVAPKFNIIVDENSAIDAMAILNSNGLPKRMGTNLLSLFGKQGFMSTDKEETIRYQAGLAQQIANMILMIDGVIDASVQLSFPQEGAPETAPQKVTAAVFVKHQGIIDDPNSHLENKIKRLVSGSVAGLDINDVTVVSDRSRFTDISESAVNEEMGTPSREYVKIWSIVMSRESAHKFRLIFFLLLFISLIFASLFGLLIWKVYPLLKTRGGAKDLLSPIPFFRAHFKNPFKKEGHPPEGE